MGDGKFKLRSIYSLVQDERVFGKGCTVFHDLAHLGKGLQTEQFHAETAQGFCQFPDLAGIVCRQNNPFQLCHLVSSLCILLRTSVHAGSPASAQGRDSPAAALLLGIPLFFQASGPPLDRRPFLPFRRFCASRLTALPQVQRRALRPSADILTPSTGGLCPHRSRYHAEYS